jgi:glycosyltransferase involved in cell wall biosynthesis
MRYAWDQFDAYFGPDQVGRPASALLRPVMAAMARWDARTATRVDRFLANSQYVAGRIRRYYNRGSTVVYPPVDTDFFQPPADRSRATSVLVVSALVPYKRLDLAIGAARLTNIPLQIVGQGPEEARLRRIAEGAPVEFLGWRSDEDVRSLYQSAAAVVLPGIEDFGIVPVEAQACGTPVVALADGGATETVIDGETGALVEERSAEAFAAGITRVRGANLDPEGIRRNAERFSKAAFRTAFTAAVDAAMGIRGDRPRSDPADSPGDSQ